MKYKKFTFACVLLGLSLYAGVCAATVREVADEAPASKQTIIADKKDKKLLNKKQRAVQITQEKDKIVVSTKPVAKPSAGTINVPAAPRPSLLQEKDGKFYFSGTQLPDDYRNIAIYGEAIASKAQAVAYILAANPAVKLACPVEELVELYWQEAKRENVRPDLALAQSLVETGAYRYGGDVLHHQNNFCGLGTTGGGVRGASFDTPQLGVRAHIQHLLAYTQTKRPSTDIVDPRYDLAHNIRLERGVVNTWYGLNGTWAMGSLYCEKIMATYQKILAQQPAEPEIKPAPAEPVKEKNKKKRSMKQRVSEILQEKK